MSTVTLPVVIPIDRFNSIAHINPPVRVDGKEGRKHWLTNLRNPDKESHHAVVVLNTDADIRAYVPDLIVAVAGLPEGIRSFKEPVALWDSYFKDYRLVDYLSTQGIVCTRLAHDSITGKTREECLLNGLMAALNAAKV